jgi:hypothetical protein
VFDQVRGATVLLTPDSSGAESTNIATLTSFDADGFTLGSHLSVNQTGKNMVAWQWEANGSGSSNEDGSINTTATSANTTAGFSISTYTGTGSNATVGHGLGVAPKMVIVKRRNAVESWRVWHYNLTDGTKYLNLENTDAQQTLAAMWNSTVPSSTVVSIGTNASVNASSSTYVMYAFAEIPGYSSFGGYTGNGSTNGTFVYTGFKPAFVILKRTNATGGWFTYDSKRDPENALTKVLQPDSSAAEVDSIDRLDFLSNGFKLRTSSANNNASGGTFIYMAFAENPFGGDGAAPATAR